MKCSCTQGRIDGILHRYHRTDRMRCDKVIVVTHSMGGLVVRHCAEVPGDCVYGIVHGVIPTLGTAVVYRRIQAAQIRMLGAQRVQPPMPRLPNHLCLECLLKALQSGSALAKVR